MARAYYSAVFEQPAHDIWKIIRDFNNYAVWVAGASESRIEDGKSGDAVGAIRNVLYQGRHIRQRLLAQSDVEWSQTYEFCEAPTLPMTGFLATLRVTPVVDGDRVSNGGPISIASPPDAMNSPRLCGAGSENGSNLYVNRWSLARPSSPRRPVRRPLKGYFEPILPNWSPYRGLYGTFHRPLLAVAFAVRIWHRSAVAGDN